MMTDSILELRDVSEDLLLQWLDLYETSFPACEKVLVSTVFREMKWKGEEKHRVQAIVGEDSTVLGLRWTLCERTAGVIYLWYLAVRRDLRGRGLGGKIYEDLVNEMGGKSFSCMVFEVEIPELMEDEELRRTAERRIEFYRRHGARLLGGIRYLQQVGWHQPAIPMHVMVHPFVPMDASLAYDKASKVLDNLSVAGTLTLE